MPNFPFRLLFSLLILSLKGLQIDASSCYTYLVPETQTPFACGSPGSFNAAAMKISSPLKKLSLSLTLLPKSFCLTTTDYTFLTLTIIPPGTAIRKKIMMLSYSTSQNRIYILSEDMTGIKTMSYRSLPNVLNQPIGVFMGVDLTVKSFKMAYLVTAGFYTPPIVTTLTYDTDWVFDSSTLLSLCADENGGSSIGCIAQNVKVTYHIPNYHGMMPFTNNVTMIADYKLNEGKGKLLKNSQGSLGSASLSPLNSPIWASSGSGGLQFNSNPNQYIKLPGFVPAGQDLTVSASIAFAFYMKFDQAPTTEGKILSYLDSLSTEVFSLTITPAMKVKTWVGTSGTPMSGTFAIGQWVTVYISYSLNNGLYGVSMIFINGGVYSGFASTYISPNSTALSASDTVKIGGGFTGQLRRIQIYSPGALALDAGSEACNPSVCTVDVGFSDPPICLTTTCGAPGYYPSFGSCEPCPKTCATCTNAGTCQTCNPGNYFLSSSCIPCPKGTYLDSPTTCAACSIHCNSCEDAHTCTSCDTGYGLYNDICMICPAGTYLNNEGICKKVSQTLQDTLTNSQLLNSGATQAANIISKGKAISLSAAVSGKIFSQIKYLNISYSGELQVALLTWLPSFVSLGLTPDMPGSMLDKVPEHPVPYVFEKYDVPSSFLINFWENLGVIVFVTVLWLLFKGSERFLSLKKNPRIAVVLRKGRVLIQNFLITALYGVYGDLVMFSIVEYRTMVFGWNLTLLSFFVSLILLIAMFGSFLYQIKLLKIYQNLKQQNPTNSNLLEQFTRKNEGSQVFWKDFKDYSLAPQFFLIFMSGRDLLFSLLLATMFRYPLAQTILIMILNCLMIVYLFIKKPFESNIDFGQQLFFEFVGLTVNFGVFINAILDTGKYEAFGARNNLGKLIIVCNIIFNFVTAGFMLLFIAQVLVDFYKAQQQKRAKKIETLKILQRNQKHTLPNENVNFDHNPIQNNNSEIVSLQQESFDLSLLPNQLQPVSQYRRPRKILRNPRPRNIARREIMN